jgi:hypothetical protein
MSGGHRGRLASTLTKRTISVRAGRLTTGSADARLITSRAEQIMISVTKGNLRSNSNRSFARPMGFITTKVPAAPTLTIPYLLNFLANTLGRKRRWPPTLTPFKNTTNAINLS